MLFYGHFELRVRQRCCCRASVPTMLHYESLLGSMYNTPPCWSIYMCGLAFQHMLDLGGLQAVQANNVAKAKVQHVANH